MLDGDHSDWLHSNLTFISHVKSGQDLQNGSTSAGGHGQKSFAEKSEYCSKKRQRDSSDQKRQRERDRYSSMTDGEKEICLRKKREYKKLVRENSSPLITSHCTPYMQAQPCKTNPTGTAGHMHIVYACNLIVVLADLRFN